MIRLCASIAVSSLLVACSATGSGPTTAVASPRATPTATSVLATPSPTLDPATPSPTPAEPSEASPFTGDIAHLLIEAEEHIGSPVRVTGNVGIVAEGGPLISLTREGSSVGEILVLIDTRLNGGVYTLDYVRGEPAEVTGTLHYLTAENIDSVGNKYLDGEAVIGFICCPEYLIIARRIVQR